MLVDYFTQVYSITQGLFACSARENRWCLVDSNCKHSANTLQRRDNVTTAYFRNQTSVTEGKDYALYTSTCGVVVT